MRINPENKTSTEAVAVLGRKYSVAILWATAKPRSASWLSQELDIPIATCCEVPRGQVVRESKILVICSRRLRRSQVRGTSSHAYHGNLRFPYDPEASPFWANTASAGEFTSPRPPTPEVGWKYHPNTRCVREGRSLHHDPTTPVARPIDGFERSRVSSQLRAVASGYDM